MVAHQFEPKLIRYHMNSSIKKLWEIQKYFALDVWAAAVITKQDFEIK